MRERAGCLAGANRGVDPAIAEKALADLKPKLEAARAHAEGRRQTAEAAQKRHAESETMATELDGERRGLLDGRPVAEVNRLLKQFKEMQKFMKQMKGMMGGMGGAGGMPPGMPPGMLGR